jgi:act minimal PKS ketosynthase (KS/KS alpha)
MSRRVVITGTGVIAPGGIGKKEFWNLLSEGRTATRGITFFDPSEFRSRVAAEIDFDPEAHGLSRQEIRRTDRAAQLAIVASREAIGDSGLDFAALDPSRVGVAVGTAIGATMSLEREYRVLSDDGKNYLVDSDYAMPHLYNFLVPSSFARELAHICGAEGPVTVVSTGCTSGLDSVGHAVELIRDGSADIMITGAADAPISSTTVRCFDAIKATSTSNDDPAHASRPFDLNRNGFVLGEGSAIFVLEDLEHAQQRHADIYAEVVGFGSRCNAYHMTGLRADGAELAQAIKVALNEARMNPDEIDYVNAHGSGTKQNDRHETEAFRKSLGEHAYNVPVSSIKSMIGHSLGAIGSLEIAASVLAMRNNVVPPTANLETPDPDCDLDYVPRTARECQVDSVLSVGSGFGGFQSAIVLRSVEGSA